VLTENLRSLERDGYLTRAVKPGPPVEVSYELNELGETLVEALKPLEAWAARSYPAVKKARAAYDGKE